MIIVTVAPAAYIGQALCKQAYHYVSPNDIVPKIDKKGRRLAADSVFELRRLLASHGMISSIIHLIA